MNPLPPQAYTKETLARAYQWLATQPDNIRELATSPDLLVSLYLKAKLNGESSLERPSIQNFRSELKQLSQMMDHLNLAPDQPSIQNSQNLLSPSGSGASGPGPSGSSGPNNTPYPQNNPPSSQANLISSPSPSAPAPSPSTAHSTQGIPNRHPPISAHSTRSLELDAKSWQSLLEVQRELNLSSESEALRAVIALGVKRLRSI